MEIDISKRVNWLIKYWLFILLAFSCLIASGIWFYQTNNRYLKIYDAEVCGPLVRVPSRTNGTISELTVKNGTAVNAGDTLAKVKVNITEEQIKQLEHSVELARKNLAKVQEGIVVNQPVYSGGSSVATEEAAAQLEKMEKLYAMGAISAAKRDEAVANYEASQMGGGGAVSFQTVIQPSSPQVIQNAEAKLKFAEISLAKAQQQSSETVIKAPVPGTVFYNDVKVNSDIIPGQVVFNIGSVRNLWIEAHLSEDQFQFIELGQFVEYEINGKTLSGSVMDISKPQNIIAENATPEQIKNAGKYTVKISLLLDDDVLLNPGTKATLKIGL